MMLYLSGNPTSTSTSKPSPGHVQTELILQEKTWQRSQGASSVPCHMPVCCYSTYEDNPYRQQCLQLPPLVCTVTATPIIMLESYQNKIRPAAEALLLPYRICLKCYLTQTSMPEADTDRKVYFNSPEYAQRARTHLQNVKDI